MQKSSQKSECEGVKNILNKNIFLGECKMPTFLANGTMERNKVTPKYLRGLKSREANGRKKELLISKCIVNDFFGAKILVLCHLHWKLVLRFYFF